MVFYKNKKVEIVKILRKLCEWKGVKIIETENSGAEDTYVGSMKLFL